MKMFLWSFRSSSKVSFQKAFMFFTLITFIFLGTNIIGLMPVPSRVDSFCLYPESFTLLSQNYFEMQGPNQCSAFSLAFALRHFGMESYGGEIYPRLSHRSRIFGYVLPKGIVSYARSNGFDARVYRGSLDSMKYALSQNNPVIVLIGDGLKWQHYMTFVGYNKHLSELYFFDPRRSFSANQAEPSFITLTEDEFLRVWRNGLPIYSNVYIVISQLASYKI